MIDPKNMIKGLPPIMFNHIFRKFMFTFEK